MPHPLLEPYAPPDQSASLDGRRRDSVAALILTELEASHVVYMTDDDEQPPTVVTFGTMREVCPKCRQGLQLILRQSSVRVAHLFCADCVTYYDATYTDGAPALTI